MCWHPGRILATKVAEMANNLDKYNLLPFAVSDVVVVCPYKSRQHFDMDSDVAEMCGRPTASTCFALIRGTSPRTAGATGHSARRRATSRAISTITITAFVAGAADVPVVFF